MVRLLLRFCSSVEAKFLPTVVNTQKKHVWKIFVYAFYRHKNTYVPHDGFKKAFVNEENSTVRYWIGIFDASKL